MKKRRKVIRVISACVIVAAFLFAWGTVGALDINSIPERQGYLQLAAAVVGLLLGYSGMELTA